jgi:hypothetical protein
VYYSENAPLAIRKRSNLPDQFSDDPEFFPPTFTHPGKVWKHPELLDLESWAQRGKLLWLDPDTLALTAWHEEATHFPYQNIKGYKWQFEIIKGKLQFRYGAPPSESRSA